jgi:hypothetical protein
MEQLPDSSEPTESSSLAVIVDSIGAFLGRVPVSLQRNVAKALGHLFKVPNAYLDGLAAELRATSEARVKITKATGTKLAQAVEVDSALAEVATQIHASKILRHQKNTIQVIKFAAEEISSMPYDQKEVELVEMSDDWLNAFESEAVNMSSEQMQKLFGKMLAGEICRPSAFSIRTVKLMGQMDIDVAEIFRKFCSITSSHRIGPEAIVLSGCAISLGKNYTTALHNFGLPYSHILALEEYGLIASRTPGDAPCFFSIYTEEDNFVQVPLKYNNEEYVLIPKKPKPATDFSEYDTLGIELSRVGRELLSVVEVEENCDYTKELIAYFDKEGLLFHKAPHGLQKTYPQA